MPMLLEHTEDETGSVALRPQYADDRHWLVPLSEPWLQRWRTLCVFAALMLLPVLVWIDLRVAVASARLIAGTVQSVRRNMGRGSQPPSGASTLRNLAVAAWGATLTGYLGHVFLFDRRWRRDGAGDADHWLFGNGNPLMRAVFRGYYDYFPARCVFDGDDLDGLDTPTLRQRLLGNASTHPPTPDPSVPSSRGASLDTSDGSATPDVFTSDRVASAEQFVDRHLPLGQNYLFCCHPHGFLAQGMGTSFMFPTGDFFRAVRRRPWPDAACNGDATRRAWPYRLTLHTFPVNFFIPGWRELLMAGGMCDASWQCLVHRMRPRTSDDRQRAGATNPAAAVGAEIAVLQPGGATEAIDCTMPLLTLRRRSGFLRVAMETGCSLVPVFTFGETSLYKPLFPALLGDAEYGRNVVSQRACDNMRRLQRLTAIGTPLVHGRGVFDYCFGLLPFQRPLVTVVGKPLPVRRYGQGGYTPEDVGRERARYEAALCALYRKYQPVFDPHSPWPELLLR